MKHVFATACFLSLLAPAVRAQEGPNLVLNGDFEYTTAPGCQMDLANAAFNALVPHVTAFGTGNNVDRLDQSCWGTPFSGAHRIALATTLFTYTADEVALELSTPVVAGATYRVRFWTYSSPGMGVQGSPVQYGFSSSPTDFGTLLGTALAPPPQVWTLRDDVIVAPVDASYLTLRPTYSPAWIQVDAVELHCIYSSGAVYCTPKTNSLGCVPLISSTGGAYASQGSDLTVYAAPVRNQKPGLLLYGVTGRAAAPFQGGFLCVAPPVRRAVPANSGGLPAPANDCSGVYALDMGAFASGALGGSPLPALSLAGTVVDCQWWGRDPGFAPPDNTALSAGLEYVVAP